MLSLLHTQQVKAINFSWQLQSAAGMEENSDPGHLTTQLLRSTQLWRLSS